MLIFFQTPVPPVSFWSSPAFTNMIMGLGFALTAALTYWLKTRQDKATAASTLNAQNAHETAKVAAQLQVVNSQKLDTIQTHTNGMLTAMQTKVDSQNVDAINLAKVTDLNAQIAALQKANIPVVDPVAELRLKVAELTAQIAALDPPK